MRRISLTLCAVAAAAVFASACDNVDYITLEPANVSLRTKGDSVWMKAMGKSQTGHEYPKTSMTWSMKDESIAKVDDTGKVTPVKSGATELVVSHGKVTASVPVEVLLAEKMTVEPKSLTLKQGEDGLEFKVHVFDYKGREMKDRTAAFHAKDADKKNPVVSMAGSKAFPLNPGKAQVEVRVEDLTEIVEVTVEPDATAKK